jgi:hypothetical protein
MFPLSYKCNCGKILFGDTIYELEIQIQTHPHFEPEDMLQ